MAESQPVAAPAPAPAAAGAGAGAGAPNGPNPASMTPPASADGEKPSSPSCQNHQPQSQNPSHPQLTSPQLSDVDLDANANSNSSSADGSPEQQQERLDGEVEGEAHTGGGGTGTGSGSAGDDDDDDIHPDHYYGGGKIPVFRPTMDQFRDFQAFVRKVNKYGMQSGVIKVIPPQEWVDSLPDLENPVKSIRVKNPIVQEFHGSHGTYTQANIEKQRAYNLPQWKAVCDEPSHQPPARRGERRRNHERPTRSAKTRSDSQRRKPDASKAKQEKASDDGPDNRNDESKPEGPPTPVSPRSKPVEAKSEELSDGESLPAAKPKGRQPKSVSARRKYNRGVAAEYIDEEAFKGFDYRLSAHDEYTPERCEELETTYWKSLMYNNPMYAADMPGSLFNDSVTSWNVAKLPNLLDVLGSKVPGVNTAYLYLGMWKATFAWHLEDVDLYSINYIHFGAPKQWYSISQEDLPKFEAAMKQMWPADAKHCNQFLRHKTYLISPTILKSQFGITVNRMVHHEREFVITFPYGYHSGYNLGYNCAESVNFATEKWLDYGRVAKKCNCESDSVWIDIAEIERKLRGESTPEPYDEMASDDQLDGASDILTPPRSVPEKSATRVKKRKLEGKEPRAKRAKLHVEGPRKIPCVLCPNNLDYEELLPTEDGKSHAHRRCALYIEETSILKDDAGREVVCDIDKIPKARMGLKCLFCREVRGACFQCMHGKCARSYHPTCALLAGVQVEFGELSVVADDGGEYAVPGVDLKCKYHRPKKYSAAPAESWSMDPKVVDRIRKHRAGDLVQFQADKEINGAVVLENRPWERSLLLKVLPRGDVIELPYQWILFVKKSNFLPLPAGIKPLPAHLARKADSRKDMASSLPSHGTPFADANSIHQWAEFSCVRPPFNPDMISPSLFKPASLWHYLGKTSTECRAQYTDDPAKPVHNPRSNFLESVKSLRAPTHPHHPPTVASSATSSSYQRPQHPPTTSSTHASWPTVGARPRPPIPSSSIQPPANRPIQPPQPQPIPSQSTTQTSYVQQPAAHSSTTQSTSQPSLQPTTSHSIHTTSRQTTQSDSVQPETKQPENTTANNNSSNKLAVWNLGDRSAQLGMARRLVTSITDHANHCAGYTIVEPGFTVQTLLGPSGAEPPTDGLEKLRKAMSESKVQARSSNGLRPLQPLNMEADEVDHLLRMLRFAILNLTTGKHDPVHAKAAEKTKPEPAKQPRDPFPDPMGWAYLEVQKRHSTPVYRSPYAPGFGFTEYAKQEYGLTDVLRPARRESLSADFFAKLSPEDQEKVIQACGNAAPASKKGMGMDDPVDQAMELENTTVNNLGQKPPSTTTAAPMDAMHTDDSRLSVFDMTLRADSPASSFGKIQFHYQSPQDFSSHIEHEASILPKHLHEHHDLFGDQQANQRFWGRSAPWTADGESYAYDEEHRPFFGPHLKPGHDYAASDMDIERGPGSLHSMDMAGFGFDGTDDIPSP